MKQKAMTLKEKIQEMKDKNGEDKAPEFKLTHMPAKKPSKDQVNPEKRDALKQTLSLLMILMP
jgi:hypothetical protein